MQREVKSDGDKRRSCGFMGKEVVWFLGLCLGLASCASSPYDRAIRDGERAQRDQDQLTEDVLEVVERLVAAANAGARTTAGQVFVDGQEFRRLVVFVPKLEPDPGLQPIFLYAGSPGALPGDAVFEEWSDEFALAQEQSYSFGAAEVSAIEQRLTRPFFTATVLVVRKATRRWAFAGSATAQPEPPEGYAYWQIRHRLLRALGGQTLSDGKLPSLKPLPGERFTPAFPTNQLVNEAVGALAQEPTREFQTTFKLLLNYNDATACWELDSIQAENASPRPTTLSWSHGTDGYVDTFVYDADDLPWQ